MKNLLKGDTSHPLVIFGVLMAESSFKERVKDVIISEASAYNQNFVNYEYLVCCDAFQFKDYYIVDAKPDNFQHLTGVSSTLSPEEFFNRCNDGTLGLSDFSFSKRGTSEKSVKGTVRRKIKALPHMVKLFESEIIVEETFVKNNVSCSFATTDNNCTVGFINNSKSVPMSLIKGNELDLSKTKSVNLLLRKHITKEKFDEMIIGTNVELIKYYDSIKDIIDYELILGKSEYEPTAPVQESSDSDIDRVS